MNGGNGIKIFGGSASQRLAGEISTILGIELGKADVHHFSEGNTFVRVQEKVRDKDVYIIQTIGRTPNDDFMELLFWIDAFRRASAGSITAIIPYFSYAKGDKKDEPRVSIRARVCADCLEAEGVDRIVTMDLHSPQIQGFFMKPVDHLYGLPTLCDAIGSMNLPNLVIVSPDAGFAKNARMYADRLRVGVAIGDKTRVAHDEKAQVLDLIGDVRGKTAMIVDDFTISCGTLIETARMLEARGAQRILACVSHALLGPEGVARLMDSPIEQLLITDTVENPATQSCPKVKTVSIAPLFAQAIDIIQHRESLSSLFD